MAKISFCVLPWRKRNLMIARVCILLKSRASLTCFRACFLSGRAKDLSAPGIYRQNTQISWMFEGLHRHIVCVSVVLQIWDKWEDEFIVCAVFMLLTIEGQANSAPRCACTVCLKVTTLQFASVIDMLYHTTLRKTYQYLLSNIIYLFTYLVCAAEICEPNFKAFF